MISFERLIIKGNNIELHLIENDEKQYACLSIFNVKSILDKHRRIDNKVTARSYFIHCDNKRTIYSIDRFLDDLIDGECFRFHTNGSISEISFNERGRCIKPSRFYDIDGSQIKG